MIGDYISAQAFYTQNYLHNNPGENVLQSFIQGPHDLEDAGMSPPHIQQNNTQQDEESESLLNSHRRSRS